jgi:YHS domain-containing protein
MGKQATRRWEIVSRTAICPICGHKVDAEKPVGGSYQYEGKIYRFCTAKERRAFAAGPERILERAARRRGSGRSHYYGPGEEERRGA